MELKAGLYIVSTPIGNLDDITIRALYVLKNSQIIYCEDTRNTQKLLQKHEIKPYKLSTYNDHSDETIRTKIIKNIKSGKIVSLVSDAGTPLISDPGYKLVRQVQEESLHIDFLPGPSALIAGLVLSGLSTDKFYFGGFMPRGENAREKLLSSLSMLQSTLIFYEAPSRLKDTLNSVLEVLTNREVVIARELTKMFQEIIRGKVSDLLSNFKQITLKGEFVILIEKDANKEKLSIEELEERIKNLKKIGMSGKDIFEKLQSETDLKLDKNHIYKIAQNFN